MHLLIIKSSHGHRAQTHSYGLEVDILSHMPYLYVDIATASL